MPTYDYKCDSCGHAFEKFQSISAAALKKCPVCGKLSLRRLIGTGAAILFKGSGFYQTDYRSESYKAAAKADQESTKAPADKASANGTGGPAGPGTSPKAPKSPAKTSKSEP